MSMVAREIRFRAFSLLGAIAIGSAVPLLFVVVTRLGRNIPPHDLATGYLMALVWGVAVGVLLWLLPLPAGDRPIVLGIWAAKVAVTLGFELVYEAKYAILDAYFYFSEAKFVEIDWNELAIGDGTRNMIILTRLHNAIFPDSFHLLKVSWALVGLLGVYAFYRAFVAFLGEENPRLLWILGLCPSILFWSSTFGKDPIALLGIGLYTFGFTTWYCRGRGAGMGWMLAGAAVAMIVRIWLVVLLLIPLCVLGLLGVKGWWRKSLVVLCALTGMVFATRFFLEMVGFTSAQDVLEAVDKVSDVAARSGSGQAVDLATPAAFVRFLPLGMFTALFRPLPGDVMNAFGLLAGLENAALLLLLLVAVLRTHWRELGAPVLLCTVAFVIAWSLFYSVLSYVNMGGAARFKLQILPILLGLLLYLARQRGPDSAGAGPAPDAAR